jgi:hypothetical protein
MLGLRKPRWLGALMWLAASSASGPASATVGGDSSLRVLGWDASRQSILIWRAPGGESSISQLWAINLGERRVDTTTCETCLDLEADGKGRDAAERAYLAVLRRARKLAPLPAVERANWRAAGLHFACTSRARLHPDGGGWFRRQVCRFHVQGGPVASLEFSAPSEWHKPRLFRAPGHPEFLLAWVVHTGVVEFGYREDELAWAPGYPQREISPSAFARLYAG